MSVKLVQGMEYWGPIDTKGVVLQKYFDAEGYEVLGGNDSTLAISQGYLQDGRALKFTAAQNASVNATMAVTIATAELDLYIGFRIYAEGSRMRLLEIDDVCIIEWSESTGKISISGQEATKPTIKNAWQYFIIHVSKTFNTVRVICEGEDILEWPWTTTAPASYVIRWGQSEIQPVTASQHLDDVFIVDSDPIDEVISIAKPVAIVNRPPTADLIAEWDPQGEPHYPIVSQELPLEAGKKTVSTMEHDKRERYRSSAVLPIQGPIICMTNTALLRKDDKDDRTIDMEVTLTGGPTVSKTVTLTEQSAYHHQILTKDPNGIAWDQTSVEAAETGYYSV